jgi:transcriptional regulator with XRE-family HTH domain
MIFLSDMVYNPLVLRVNHNLLVLSQFSIHTRKGLIVLALEGDFVVTRRVIEDERANGNIEHGIRLAKFRKTAGMSQQELADRIGVAQPVISRYEKGQRKLYDDMLAELAKALGVTPNDILGIAPSKCVDNQASNLSKRMVARLKKIEALPRRAQDHLIGMLDMALKGVKN